MNKSKPYPTDETGRSADGSTGALGASGRRFESDRPDQPKVSYFLVNAFGANRIPIIFLQRQLISHAKT